MTSPSIPIARTIDFNCDLGEDPARIADGSDRALLQYVTSCNIACGGHAGDDSTMRAIVDAGRVANVAIGAHPSYPDRQNFGRVELNSSPGEVEIFIAEQVDRLASIATQAGVTIRHVKPHGALYHAAMHRRPIAEAIARAVARMTPRPRLVGLAGAPALDWWRASGFEVLAEGFADRRYEPDGSLRSRTKPDSVLPTSHDAALQAVQIASGQGVTAIDGTIVPTIADTLCIHSDSPGSLAIAAAVRAALEHHAINLAAPPESHNRPGR